MFITKHAKSFTSDKDLFLDRPIVSTGVPYEYVCLSAIDLPLHKCSGKDLAHDQKWWNGPEFVTIVTHSLAGHSNPTDVGEGYPFQRYSKNIQLFCVTALVI